MNYNEACNILGVNKNDTLEDIKKKYRELATKYHPDINKEKDATEKTQQINLAFEFICKNYNNRKIEFCKFLRKEKHFDGIEEFKEIFSSWPCCMHDPVCSSLW